MKKTFLLFISAFILVLINAEQSKAQNNTKNTDILFYQKIPLSDSINLSANIYLPHNLKEKLPVILVFTPYVSDHNHDRGMFFSQNGYVFATVDVRGRGNSEGIYTPLETDAKDGSQVIQWLAKQSWSNGKVAMMGGSYKGMVQWLIMKEFPPALKTVVPTASVGPGIDFPKKNNIFYPYGLRWLTFTSGKTLNKKSFGEEYWDIKKSVLYNEHKAFSDYTNIVPIDDNTNKIFQKWISHPDMDDYWKSILPNKEQYAKMNIPVLTITGYYDDDQPGALNYYNQYMKYASQKAKENHYLIIGPWNHSGTRRPKEALGDLYFGKNAVVNIFDFHLQWFNWTLKGQKRPDFLKDKVMYYQTGEDRWDYAESIEKMTTSVKKFYLSSSNQDISDVFHSGTLQNTKITNKEKPSIIIYNPLENTDKSAKWFTMGDFKSENYTTEKGWLYFHSEIFDESFILSGKVLFEAYIELDAQDTDFEISLYEITQNGESIWLGSDIMRARYRNSLEKPELVTPKKIEKYTFDKFTFNNRKIAKGSRLRFVFGYLDTKQAQKNYNTGGKVSEESKKNAKTVTIKLYHNSEYPSSISIPMMVKQ